MAKMCGDVGALLLVDGDEPALVDEHAGVARRRSPAVGPAPDGDQHLVEHGGLGAGALLAPSKDTVSPSGPASTAVTLVPSQIASYCLVIRLVSGRDDVLVGAGDELVHQLDHA